MKKSKKIIIGIIVLIIIIAIVVTTYMIIQNNNKSSETGTETAENVQQEDLTEEVDYTQYTDLFTSKIIGQSLYYYGIEDINNDGFPELIGKSGNDNNPNFKLFKLTSNELTEIVDSENKTNFSGIKELTRNEYSDGKVIYIISSFGTTYISNGTIINLAYIEGNTYVEYGKLVGLDLDTLENSKLYKRTFNLDTLEITEKTYEFTVDTTNGITNALVSEEYDSELEKVKSDLENNKTNTQSITFYENIFSESSHDDTELTEQVRNILKELNNNSTEQNDTSVKENNNEVNMQSANLTLEKLREVLTKRNITLEDKNSGDENSINILYQANDFEHSTYYSFNIYETEDDAIRNIETSGRLAYYKEDEIAETVKDEDSEHINKYEIVMNNGTIYIDYRENNCILRITIQNDGGEDARSIAEEICKELGF